MPTHILSLSMTSAFSRALRRIDSCHYDPKRNHHAKPKGYKYKSMLNSAEHELYHAFGGILTIISMINTTSESLTAIKFTIFQYFTYYE